MTKPKNICIYGGPGVGKSTISSGLFYQMKTKGYKVEFITEYAKDLTYGKDFVKLKDQLLVFANQFHKYYKLQNLGLDFLIHESPILLSLVYYSNDNIIPEEEFKKLVLSIYNNTENINIFLDRNLENEYQEFGRNQDLMTAKQIDEMILSVLNENNIPYIRIKSGKKTHKEILKILKDYNV